MIWSKNGNDGACDFWPGTGGAAPFRVLEEKLGTGGAGAVFGGAGADGGAAELFGSSTSRLLALMDSKNGKLSAGACEEGAESDAEPLDALDAGGTGAEGGGGAIEGAFGGGGAIDGIFGGGGAVEGIFGGGGARTGTFGGGGARDGTEGASDCVFGPDAAARDTAVSSTT